MGMRQSESEQARRHYKSALALAIPRRKSSVKLVIAKSSLLSNKMVIASIKIGMKKEKKS
jgi:hypothetical protein